MFSKINVFNWAEHCICEPQRLIMSQLFWNVDDWWLKIADRWPLSVFLKKSDIWAKFVIYIKFPSVCMSVCLSVCPSLTFFENNNKSLYLSQNKDNDTKFSGYDPWGLSRSSMLSRMTLSSVSPVRNPQRPPSPPLLDPPFLTHFWLSYQHEIFRVCSLG